MRKQATITSKERITASSEVRRILGVRAEDKLLFENDKTGVRVRPVRSQSSFSKYRGIGNPGIGSGKKSIARLRPSRDQ
jgi:bifunctional DNA-binding transcriptional regulator/antitoxin component of YhaV-PrlF toxin-antitoxin module